MSFRSLYKNGYRRLLPKSLLTRALANVSLVRNFSVAANKVPDVGKKLLCAGCGVGLQSRNEVAAGYIPSHKTLLELERIASEALEKSGSSDADKLLFGGHGIVCRRCFQTKHYGRLVPLKVPLESWREYAHAITNMEPRPLLVQVVDVWDFHGSLLGDNLEGILHAQDEALRGDGAHRSMSSSNPYMLVINKLDLLPFPNPTSSRSNKSPEQGKSVAGKPPSRVGLLKKQVEQWARTELKHLKHVKYNSILGVHCVSANRGWGIQDLLEDIKAQRKGRDVYFVGAPNVGKTSLINAVLAEAWDLPLLAPVPAHIRAKQLSSDNKGSTVFLSDLPEGYRVGDVFTGDLASLEGLSEGSHMTTGQQRSLNDCFLSDDPGAPVVRRRGDYGEVPLTTHSSDTLADEVEGLLQAERDRKARHLAKKELGAGEDQLLSRLYRALDSKVTTLDTSNGNGNGNGTGSRPTKPGTAPPELPFTASPLPGTTLGVIGTALDGGGSARVFDTPGVVLDPARQRLLEDLAGRIEQRAMEQEAQESQGGGLSNTSSSSSNGRALASLVPQKRWRQPQIVRLSPGRSLFLGGLLRIDYVHPDPACHLLLGVESTLKPHLTATHKAEELWQRCAEEAMQQQQQRHASELLWPRHGGLQYLASLPLRKLVSEPLRPMLQQIIANDFRASMDFDDMGEYLRYFSPTIPTEMASYFSKRDESASLHRHAEFTTGRSKADLPDERTLSSRLPPSALAPYSSHSATAERRKQRQRTALADVAFPGIGWVAIAPVEVLGLVGWGRTMAFGALHVHGCDGVSAHARTPLLPHLLTGTTPDHWMA